MASRKRGAPESLGLMAKKNGHGSGNGGGGGREDARPVADAPTDTDIYTVKNHIYFKTMVSQKSVDKLVREIETLRTKLEDVASDAAIYGEFTPQPIYLHLTTDGGDLFACLLAYDKIKNSVIPIHTIVEGCVMSAGSILSIAGAKRFMTPNSHLLIHQLSSMIMGPFEQILDEMRNHSALMTQLIGIYHANSRGKMTKKQIADYLKHDILWSASTSIAHGLIDELWLL